ncbi:MAG: thioredoxin family protein [Propionibacteriales bacterium]|nr:thioredoxin family protein [Propionibacteriales bacterium]
MTGLWVVLGALIVALSFGAYRRLTDGRARTASRHTPPLDADRLGAPLGDRATFVQFSATVCAPCRSTHRVLTEVVADRPDITHIDINAETRLDLVDEFGITRTPTVLVLDATGAVRHRIVGAARTPEILDVLGQVAGPLAA